MFCVLIVFSLRACSVWRWGNQCDKEIADCRPALILTQIHEQRDNSRRQHRRIVQLYKWPHLSRPATELLLQKLEILETFGADGSNVALFSPIYYW